LFLAFISAYDIYSKNKSVDDFPDGNKNDDESENFEESGSEDESRNLQKEMDQDLRKKYTLKWQMKHWAVS